MSNEHKSGKPYDSKWRHKQYRCGFSSGTILKMERNFGNQSGLRPRQKGDKVVMRHVTKKAKRKILIAAKDLDWQHEHLGAQKPHFATLTAPRGYDGERILEGAWGNLNLAIKRKFKPLQDEEFQFVKVSQVQPQRLKKRKERVIHFHFIWNYAINKTQLMRMWKHYLNLEYAKEGTAYRCPPHVQVQNNPVEASAEQYITKYLSDFDPELAIQGNNYSISRNLLKHTKPTRKHEVDCNYSDFIECLSETLYELRAKTKHQLNVIAIQDEYKGEMMYISTNDEQTTSDFLWLMSNKLMDLEYPKHRAKRVGEPTAGWG